MFVLWKMENGVPKQWSLQAGGGRYSEVVVNSGLTVCLKFMFIFTFTDGELFAAIAQTDEEQIRDIINNGKVSVKSMG